MTDDTDLTAENLRELVKRYKGVYVSEGIEFPESPLDQLRASIYAVFDSWQSERGLRFTCKSDVWEAFRWSVTF